MPASPDRSASGWHLLTAAVATGALVLQFVLIAQGNAVLDESEAPRFRHADRPVRQLSHDLEQCPGRVVGGNPGQ